MTKAQFDIQLDKYACGKHCSLNIGGRCCRAMVMGMNSAGARIQIFDAKGIEMAARCEKLRLDMDNKELRKLGRRLECEIDGNAAGIVDVRFSKPLDLEASGPDLSMRGMQGAA